MRVLVTGLSGFTGQYLQTELEANGHSVIGLQCDLTNPTALAAEVKTVQPEVVAHLAGVAYVGHGNTNSFYEVNLIGTRNLLAALAQHASDVRNILLASSANVYGNRSEGILNEDSVPDPVNDYAVSKLAMEHMASLWVVKLPVFTVRPFNYTGVGQSENFLIPKIIAHFRNKEKVIELGNLDVSRDFGDVRSVVKTYRKLLEHSPLGGTFNVCSGKTYTLKDVVGMCEKITGHSIEIQVNSAFVRANEVRILMGDNSRLTELVGNTQAYTLNETLQWMLQDASD